MNFHPQLVSYQVEVSGWDATENFFVEKTTLEWGQNMQKEVKLKSSLREGCILFVRLLHSVSAIPNFPIAYQIMKVRAADGSGSTHVWLEQLQPRPPFKELVRDLSGSTLRVA
jgi:hypothetical protein